MTAGIYLGSPKSNSTNKVYIGQSTNIESRIVRHNSEMFRGTHSTKIQQGYQMYGIFGWEILEECSEENLDIREEYYIKLFNSVVDGFNTYSNAQEAPRLYGTLNGNVRLNDITIYKSVLDNTLQYPNMEMQKIAEISNTTKHVVSNLWYGGYSWLQDIYPLEYAEVLKLSGSRKLGGKSSKDQDIQHPTILDPFFNEYTVDNIREFARLHNLDSADLSNVLHLRVGSVKGWIIKDLDKLSAETHSRFYSTNRGYYKKQYTKYINKE